MIPMKMPFLSNITNNFSSEISSFAGCVLMVDLALRCFKHGERRNTIRFWDDYYALVKQTDDLFDLLKQHLNATSIRQDPVAFSLYLNFRATEIFSHESALARAQSQGLPSTMMVESQRRATAAAYQISTAVRLNMPSPGAAKSAILVLQATFIAWPLTIALQAFHRELANGGDREHLSGIVASSRLLFSALGHIEDSGEYWHRSVAHVERRLREWEEENGFQSLSSTF